MFEFAFEKGELYILQARAVTKIMYGSIKEQWTTANLKDGGVSEAVCTPYMWSLYEYIWDKEYRGFLVESGLLKPNQMSIVGDMFYGRPYWNLTAAKRAMAKVPGYKEREFDNELGINITYQGDGATTKITPKSILEIAVIAARQSKMVNERRKTAQALKDELLKVYESYRTLAGKKLDGGEIRTMWKRLVFEDYLKSESTYFRQIFINTIHQSIFKNKIIKYTTNGGYFNLIGGLDNISHLRPFYDIWAISRAIRENKAAFNFWNTSSAVTIRNALDNGSDEYFLGRLRKHIERFGYHSKKELDVTYPCFYEDINAVIDELKKATLLGEECSPDIDRERLHKRFNNELEDIREKVSAGAYKRIFKSITQMREILWWREEFRDISTRFYYIIRAYSSLLAGELVKENILENSDDLWFAKIGDIRAFLNGKLDKSGLCRIIERNKKYYRSFRNFTSESEIGQVYSGKAKKHGKSNLHGVGCNNGSVTATARVVASPEEIDKLQVGDILVTRFIDTGWTGKLALLNGIVTERGGMLCHAAVVAREYGIPCVVCAENATKLISDGSAITINGETDEIII